MIERPKVSIVMPVYNGRATLKRAIRRLLEDPNEHEKHAEQGLLRSREHSWVKMAEQTLNVYRDLVSAA